MQDVAKYLREWQGFSHLTFKWHVTSIISLSNHYQEKHRESKARPTQDNDIKSTSMTR